MFAAFVFNTMFPKQDQEKQEPGKSVCNSLRNILLLSLDSEVLPDTLLNLNHLILIFSASDGTSKESKAQILGHPSDCGFRKHRGLTELHCNSLEIVATLILKI